MDKLKGNLLYGQSGGPTSVINSSAYGVIKEAFKNHDTIYEVYVMKHGIQGALNEDFFHMSKEDEEQIELLRNTPGAAFGSVRYKIADPNEDETDYIRLLYIFRKYNIRYFLYNGGNDSMDTCHKIAEYMGAVGYDLRVIGVPKTIDNDLPFTDHTPGYGSAARFISNTMAEVSYDMLAYPKGKVTVVEIMGRHAGWLTAAAHLASIHGYGPDLIYLPEIPFSIEKFKDDVERIYKKKQQCLIAVSEGIMNEDGVFISSASAVRDAFGHFQLGGVATKLSQIINNEMRLSSRAITLGSTQRSAAHVQSLTDVKEAEAAGRQAVKLAIKGESEVMVTFERISDEPYKIAFKQHPLNMIANVEKKMPRSMINDEGNNVTEEFTKYALPLIEGQNKPTFEKGIQRFADFVKRTFEGV